MPSNYSPLVPAGAPGSKIEPVHKPAVTASPAVQAPAPNPAQHEIVATTKTSQAPDTIPTHLIRRKRIFQNQPPK